jgi:glucosyl-3-phosphoglycerate synthase
MRHDAFLHRERTITVCLPARNEERTIGAALAPLMAMHRDGFVDQVLVVDESTDWTATIASSMGAEVRRQSELCPELGGVEGKGDAMWRALTACKGDIILYLDADSVSIQRHYVFAMCEPLLTDEADYVKAFYKRPLGGDPDGGGRLNHLFGAPIMRTFFPELAWVTQPLAGETALTRELALSIPYEVGMAIEPALTIDAHLAGARLAQVDLAVHEHRHWPLRDLAGRCDEAMAAVLDRAGVKHQLPTRRTTRPPMRDYRNGS